MKFLAILLSILAVALAGCILLPATSLTLLQFTVGIPENAHWVTLFDIVAVAFAAKFCRRAILPSLCALCVAAWPVAAAFGMPANPETPLTLATLFRQIDPGDIQPERLSLNMLYYRPRGAGPHPVLVDIYGGAWQRGRPESDRNFNKYMASKGYGVFAIDYSHAPAFVFPAALEDVRSALLFIYSNAARYNVDPRRIALCGRSAGGQLALLAAYEGGPVPIRGVISFYGPTDLTRGYVELPSPDPMDVRAVVSTYLGGTLAQVPERFRAGSPVTLAGESVPPTLLIQGRRDHVVKAAFVRALHEKLRAAGNDSTLREIPWSEHAFDAVFSGLANHLALGYVTEFLTRVDK